MELKQKNIYKPQEPLPNTAIILALGITSIVFSFCAAPFGLICGLLALILSHRDLKEFETNSNKYTASSNSKTVAGRVCAIIGCILSGLSFINFGVSTIGKLLRSFF